jgi:hypothetical protein
VEGGSGRRSGCIAEETSSCTSASDSVQSIDFCLCSSLVAFGAFMVILDLAKIALKVVLVFGGALVLFAFERSVLDIQAAAGAPVFRLETELGEDRQMLWLDTYCRLPVFRHGHSCQSKSRISFSRPLASRIEQLC